MDRKPGTFSPRSFSGNERSAGDIRGINLRVVSRGVRVPEGTVHGPSPDTAERVSDSQDAGEGTGAGAGAGAAFVLLAVREKARNASWNKVGGAGTPTLSRRCRRQLPWQNGREHGTAVGRDDGNGM